MPRRVSKRVRMYSEKYISVSVFLCIDTDGREFYDTVIYRKIKRNGGFEWIRGANLKPHDIPILLRLLKEVNDYLVTVVKDESS